MRDNNGKRPPAVVKEPSRRQFLVNSGFALGGVVVGGAIGALVGRKDTNETEKTPVTDNTETKPAAPANFNRALMFFTPEQFAIVNAATERIFPADENGAGASALGVAFFIDHQLAGDYGFNSREYMSPPFFQGEKVQGYQGRLKRREIYEIGIRELNNYSQTKLQKKFVELTPEEQDTVLKAFEADEPQITTISPSGFFRMLRANTLEGAYSDPLYGGNANMEGWRMRNYPGNQMSYAAIIEKPFVAMEPVSLQEHMSSH
ncbi:putative dehydrogenase [Paenibacillus curdlanolyticus YK9]|uniref:Putative dehydrogenase n=1 Tax=Paenibacillus curdlanolyticus YK9 TaxID=717606 RepID=E0I644_9BACL|nr:gluconate 2-dehydrogenase subunit 3 family protein [Paenibacillus curdlanolyticus]EFM12436.1 putative dehydrogenase [Paenibacillus curdlanolyticus YK9]